MKTAIYSLGFLFIATILCNCGQPAKSSVSAHAESIGGPPGVSCYVIVTGDTAVGGGCIKN